MNSERTKKVTSEAINQLAEALKAGQSDTLTRYLAAMAKFRTYSFSNVLLIVKQCPHASRVAGYRTWQSFGRQVKGGEKGIMIFAPVFRKKTEQDKTSQNGETIQESPAVATFRPVYVFNQDQTTGNELPEIGCVTGDPSIHLERLEAFVRASGMTLEYSGDIAPARGLAAKGKIAILPNLTPAETFATLVHEVGHVLLHQSPRRAETTLRIRETEAEAVAFVVCTAIGLEPGTSAADYVTLYGGDAKLLFESLEHVQQTASLILDAIELHPQQQAA